MSNRSLSYGKYLGWKRASLIGLPTSRKPLIYSGEGVDYIYQQLSSYSLSYQFICRPDAPIGNGNKLPRGSTLTKSQIHDFYKKIYNSGCENFIILIFENPSMEILGRVIPRHEISGGVFIFFEGYDNVKIEYVGQGFDVGDITRGITFHQSIVIPQWCIDKSASDKYIFDLFKSKLFKNEKISKREYEFSLKNRLEQLKLIEENIHPKEIEKEVFHLDYMSLDKFKTIYKKILAKIVVNRNLVELDNLGVLCNFYGSMIYVFEVWDPKRSVANS